MSDCQNSYNFHRCNTDTKIEANQPDSTIKNFEQNTCTMIDVTVPADKYISLKEFQKLLKYKDLEIEVTKMWKLKIKKNLVGSWKQLEPLA